MGCLFKITEVKPVTFRPEIINDPVVCSFRFSIPIDFDLRRAAFNDDWESDSFHEWRNFARVLVPILVRLGADQQVASSAVRLTRLPGCLRGDRLQKLLYLNPDPPPQAITGLPVLRDSLAKIRLAAESYLSTSCAEVIERFSASDLTTCIEALDRHKKIVSKPREPVIRALEWFESSPIAAELLARLRRSPEIAYVG